MRRKVNGLDASLAPNNPLFFVREDDLLSHATFCLGRKISPQHATPLARIRVMPRARVSPEKRKRTARACDSCKRSKLKVPTLFFCPIVIPFIPSFIPHSRAGSVDAQWRGVCDIVIPISHGYLLEPSKEEPT